MKINTVIILLAASLIVLFTTAFGFIDGPGSWCDHPLRPELKSLREIKTKHPWFKVYDVGHNTYAIGEPYNWEETIAYLIIGNDKALLLDSGMGLDSISPVVKQLTRLPVWVLNSHTHEDHIGGNYEFKNILAINSVYTRRNAANGYTHEQVREEVSPASFCLNHLPNEDTAHYHILPFKVSSYINDGYVINLGNRELKVIRTPGHTPDAICLYDKQNRYFWTGDSYYRGPIFLFADSTDLQAYSRSAVTMAKYAHISVRILPAHNLPVIKPAELIEACNAFTMIRRGNKKSTSHDDNTLTYNFGEFSFLIGKRFLTQLPDIKK